MAIHQMFLGLGAVAKKSYVDDIFSTYVYTGNSSARSINTGIDMTEDGLVWIKNRDQAYNNSLQDTVRGAGATKKLSSNLASGQNSGDNANDWAGYISAFNNNGFSVDKTGSGSIDWANYNKSGEDYAAWTFRKAKGFFDVVTWTGDGSSNRQISHSLSSIPGLIMVKKTSESDNWNVYHRSAHATSPEDYRLFLNTSAAASTNDSAWNETKPTSSNFTVGSNDQVNGNGKSYVAYVFAGGESTAATARSVDFDGNDKLYLSADTDIDVNNGNFTIECFFNVTSVSTHQSFITDWDDMGWQVEINTDGKCQFAWGANSTSYWSIVGQQKVSAGTWNHIAVVRSGNVFTQYLNGIYDGTFTSSATGKTNGTVNIGYNNNNGNGRYVTGKISNVRIVKGTAVYTSSFKPPTAPLTNITNTGLLCCNNSSVTGSTVTPGTITASGDPTASTDSPFDDPAGFVFGEAEDQNVIKCGSYVGNGSSTGPEINLGWEPQYVLIKNVTSNSSSWNIWDSMRGIVAEGNDTQLYTDRSQEEYSTDRVDLTPTGFKLKQDNILINTDGSTYIYMCIRRPDGYVGKPLELGTSAFAMDTGAGSSTIPNYDSGFAVDIALSRVIASNDDWGFGARLLSGKRLKTNEDEEAGSGPDFTFDSNVGWNKNSSEGSSSQSWMWKRHAGMDVVAYEGNGVNGRSIAHSMNDVPEMMIVKRFSDVEDWTVYHTGLNGGTNPYTRLLTLNSTASEVDMTSTPEKVWKSTPTSTHFEIGSHDRVNTNGKDYLALLFSSIPGVSKIGSYTGSTSNLTITTGFQPRFILIKGYDSNSNGRYWIVMDSLRGINPSGNTDYLFLNQSSAQNSNGPEPFISAISSTGFTLLAGKGDTNASFPGNFTRSYIYYAHA
jgi:hypothetical protein